MLAIYVQLDVLSVPQILIAYLVKTHIILMQICAIRALLDVANALLPVFVIHA